MHQMEEINRKTWTNVWSLREYGRSEGYLDEGERLALKIATSAGIPRILAAAGPRNCCRIKAITSE